MPFKIIRNDITKVKADAVVNTANPEPRFAGGTDAAIYKAAGADALLEERRKIGRIAPGEAAVTAAFALPAKYIIHTAGPIWIDGNHGEYDILRSCYRKSLLLADQLGCESIAFPLIATGIYGFPKDQALNIALSVIREHLENSDLDVILVVFGSSSYQIAAGLVEQIEEYIDENYVSEQEEEEYGKYINENRVLRQKEDYGKYINENHVLKRTEKRGVPFRRLLESRQRRREAKRETYLSDVKSDHLPSDAGRTSSMAPFGPEDEEDEFMSAESTPLLFARKKKTSLEDAVNHLGESFQARLLRMIDERGMTDPEVYKRANIDRKLFSKIRCSEDYIPKKKTIVSLAIALRLNMDDTKDLLASAGLMLTNNNKADVIVCFCIENEIYDIFEVNALLFQFHQPILG